MSIDDIRAVYADYPGEGFPQRKATLAVLAFHAHRDTGRCCPSFETIGRETGVTARTAIRNVDALIAEGVLTKTTHRRRGGGGQFASNEYRLVLDSLPSPLRVTQPPHGAHDEPCDMDDATGCRPRRPPADTGVTGTGGTDMEQAETPSDLSPAGSDDSPSDEEKARLRAEFAARTALLNKMRGGHDA